MIAYPIPKPRLKDNPSLTGKEKTGRNGKAPVAQKTVMVRGIRRRSLLRAEYIAMLRACDAFSFLHRAVSRYFRLFLRKGTEILGASTGVPQGDYFTKVTATFRRLLNNLGIP